MAKSHTQYHSHSIQEMSKPRDYNNVTSPSNLTPIILGVFILGVVSGILITVTHHNIFGVLREHIIKGKIHPVYTPLERQRLNVSINQKLAKIKY